MLIAVACAAFYACGDTAADESLECTSNPEKQVDASFYDAYHITELYVGVGYEGATSDKGITRDSSQADVAAAYGSVYTVVDDPAKGYYYWAYDSGNLEFQWDRDDDSMIAMTVSGMSTIKIGGYGVGDSYAAFRAEHGNPSMIIGLISQVWYKTDLIGGGNCFFATVSLANN